jgi:hypothetical protein
MEGRTTAILLMMLSLVVLMGVAVQGEGEGEGEGELLTKFLLSKLVASSALIRSCRCSTRSGQESVEVLQRSIMHEESPGHMPLPRHCQQVRRRLRIIL